MVAPVLALSAYYASNRSAGLRRGFEREQRVVAEASANAIQALIDERLERLRILAEHVNIEADGDHLGELLARHGLPRPELIELVVLDPQGAVLAGYPESRFPSGAAPTVNYANRRYFRAIADGADEAVSGGLESKPPGRGGIAVALAKRDSAGKLQGAVSCILERSTLDVRLRQIVAADKHLAIDVMDGHGRRLASSRAGEPPVPLDVFYAMATDELETRHGVRAGDDTFDAVVKPITGGVMPWHAVATRPSHLREQSIRNTWFQAGWATLGVVAVGLLAAGLVSRTVADPMRRVSLAIKTLERGDLTPCAASASANGVEEVAELMDPLRHAIDHFATLVSNVRSTALTLAQQIKGLDQLNGDLRDTNAQATQHVKISVGTLQLLAETSGRIHGTLATLSSHTETATESIIILESSATSIVNTMESLSSAHRDLIDGVKRMGNEVDEIAEDFQSSNRSVECVTSALEDLNHGVQAIELAAAESARLANNTTQDAEHGRRTSQDTIRAMSDIATRFARLDQSISALASRSEEIDRIIEVIDNVTRATNLLAFNASIIAAQAGEHGAGFKVVAERVKSLADSTRQSTRDISDLVIKVRDDISHAAQELHDSARSIQDGETLSIDSDHSLAVIMESSRKAEAMVQQIRAATREQNHRLVDLGNNIEKLRNVNSALDHGTADQRKALHRIESSVARTQEIHEKVGAAARAQAREMAQISTSTRSIDGHTREIDLATKEQQRTTEALQSAIESFATSSEVGTSCSTNLEQVIQKLSEDLEKLDDNLGRFHT